MRDRTLLAQLAAFMLLVLAGCMVTGPDVIMPEDPQYAVVCEVADPPPECWQDATIEILIDNPMFTPPDTTGGG